MSKIKPKKYKISRRLGAPIFEKCQTPKYKLRLQKKLSNIKRRPRITDYGRQLMEKQKVRLMYGILEKQFSNYVASALKGSAKGVTPAMQLFQSIEKRLDNVVYRLGLAPTRRMARQLVSHGHFLVNGKKIDIPSYSVKIGDKVEIREGSKKRKWFEIMKEEYSGVRGDWLKWDAKKHVGEITGEPTTPDEILDFQTVIELYTK